MKICFVTPELTPLAKVGGLGDVSAALPDALSRLGNDLRVVLPLYRDLKIERQVLKPIAGLQSIPLDLGPKQISFSAYQAPFPGYQEGQGPQLTLIECDELYDRPGVYSDDQDEFLRFLTLCRAALTSCQHLQWAPDIVHCNDWQTGLVPLLLKTVYSWDGLFRQTRTVLTIHNLGHQGVFSSDILPFLNLGDSAHLLHQDDLHGGRISFLKTGLLYADALTAVSPTYAQQIQTSEYGMGLEDILSGRRRELYGILNGIDSREWDPQNDPNIAASYSADDLRPKAKNKSALQAEMRVAVDITAPTVGIVSRLTTQKGFDLLPESLPGILAQRDMRLVVLGSGADEYVQFFANLRKRFPDKVGFYFGFSNKLAHLIEAGSDMFLMPSRYEPCGLNQMYSQAYGTVPVVRRTGGLADTVEQFDPQTGEGTGFVFDHFTSDGLSWALNRALDIYEQSRQEGFVLWQQLMRNGMSQDFSWGVQAKKYESVYHSLVPIPQS